MWPRRGFEGEKQNEEGIALAWRRSMRGLVGKRQHSVLAGDRGLYHAVANAGRDTRCTFIGGDFTRDDDSGRQLGQCACSDDCRVPGGL